MSEIITTTEGLSFLIVDGVAVPVQNPANGVAVSEEDPKPKGKPAGKGKPASRKPAKPKKGCLTAGEAWTLLGADDKYEPSDPAKPANGRQLWALNAKGLLAVK